MKTKDLEKKKDADLVKLLKEKREALREFRFGVASGSSNTSQASALRRDIARILTEQNARARTK